MSYKKETAKRVLQPLTFAYKHIEGSSPIYLDVYPPRGLAQAADNAHSVFVPAVIYFHGGGLTVGNRSSWFPYWLEERVTASGIAFISADYRLVPPSNGHEVVEDIKDLFLYLSSKLNASILERFNTTESEGHAFQIDPHSLAVSGTSAGGLCAYLSVMHATPRPKALLALYAMGGTFTLSHYLTPKSTIFFRGRELLDPRSFVEYLPPECYHLVPTSDSPLSYHSANAPIPGYPANPRMLLARLYLQLGNFLDIYTGSQGLSEALRTAFSSVLSPHDDPDTDSVAKAVEDNTLAQQLDHISPKAMSLFPQLNVNSSWPPSFLVHGSADTAVQVEESYHMHDLLEKANVPVTLKVVPDREHSFDYTQDAEEAFGGKGGLFDEIQSFLDCSLRSS